MRQAIIFAIVSVVVLPALAIKANFRVYSKPGSRYTGTTTDNSFKYTGRSSGAYRQVQYFENGRAQYGWVYRAAISSTDSGSASASRNASSENIYEVESNYNVRTSPSFNSKVAAVSEKGNFRTTGVEKGVWREVIDENGKKGWVNRKGIDYSEKVPSTKPAPVVATKPTPVVPKPTPVVVPEQKPTTDVVTSSSPNEDSAPTKVEEPAKAEVAATPTPVPYTIINAQKPSETESGKPSNGKPEPVTVADSEIKEEVKKPESTKLPDSSKPAASGDLKSHPLCDFPSALMSKNCLILMGKVSRGEVPKASVTFALKTFKKVTGSYCGGNDINSKYRNKCSFFITDLDKRSSKDVRKSAAFLVDLCAGDSSKSAIKDVVTVTGTNRGSGSATRRGLPDYSDVPEAKRTLAGIFMTKGVRAFIPRGKGNANRYSNMVNYKPGDPNCVDSEGAPIYGNNRNNYLKSCGVIALEMTRINGARTDDDKPMHTSPYGSSSGCPSVAKSDNWIMRNLASQGNSLFIAYTEQASQADNFKAADEVCVKDPDTLPRDDGNGMSGYPGRIAGNRQ